MDTQNIVFDKLKNDLRVQIYNYNYARDRRSKITCDYVLLVITTDHFQSNRTERIRDFLTMLCADLELSLEVKTRERLLSSRRLIS